MQDPLSGLRLDCEQTLVGTVERIPRSAVSPEDIRCASCWQVQDFCSSQKHSRAEIEVETSYLVDEAVLIHTIEPTS